MRVVVIVALVGVLAACSTTPKTSAPPAHVEGTAPVVAPVQQETATAKSSQHETAPTRNAQEERAKHDVASSAKERANAWVADALQIGSVEKRQRAVESVRAALAGDDADLRRAALRVLPQIAQVEFDKPSFRPLVLPLLAAPDPETRVAAAFALSVTALQDGDVALVLPFASDPAPVVQENIARLLFVFARGDLTGAAGERVLALLSVDPPAAPRSKEGIELERRLREHMHGLWGARLSPALEARVIELTHSSDREIAHEATYFVLSTQENKSKASVARLVELLADPDPNTYLRAVWGLGHGVEADARGAVADAMLALLEARSDLQVRQKALFALRQSADATHVERIRALAAQPAIDEGSKRTLLDLAARLESH